MRRGAISKDNQPGHKLFEVQNFMTINKVAIMSLIEVDIHMSKSRITRANQISHNEASQILGISGYKLIFPTTWHN